MSNEDSINYNDICAKIKKLEDELDELKNLLNENIDNDHSENEAAVLSESSGRFLTLEDILGIGEKYYDESRWNTYYQEIIDLLESFSDIGSVLEMGPYKAPFVENCDVIDKVDYSEFFPLKANEVIIHDCSVFPYPIEDKKYDLVIASQVFEHIGYFGEQIDAFKELARISKRAIIALPYKWHRPLHRSHHMIDENVFDAWQGDFVPVYENIAEYTITRIYDFGE